MLAIMASHPQQYDNRHSDVNNASLSSKLNAGVYVKQPVGYEAQGGQVLTLRKTLYALKQSPHEWHAVLFRELELLDPRRSIFDPSVFINADNRLIMSAFIRLRNLV